MKNIIKVTFKWLITTRWLSFPRRLLGRIIVYASSIKRGILVLDGTYLIIFHGEPDNIEAINLISQIKKETEMLISDFEAYQIYLTVKKTEKIEGDIAEVGVYKGGSAKLISKATSKPLHLFDTFEGLPEISKNDSLTQFHKGKYRSSYDSVKNYLKEHRNLHLYRGLFPSTAGPVKNRKFSFVHLDVDIYESTINCLEFFYPRMSRGGVIISHDYPNARGVKKAVDEFFKDKLEIIIKPMETDQCLIVKT